MNISYNVPIEANNLDGKGKWKDIVRNFMNSDKDNMCIELSNRDEINTAYNSIYQTIIKRHKVKGIALLRRGSKLYIIKEELAHD